MREALDAGPPPRSPAHVESHRGSEGYDLRLGRRAPPRARDLALLRQRGDEEDAERFSHWLPPERMHAAWDGDEVAGGAGAFPFELSVPGGRAAGGRRHRRRRPGDLPAARRPAGADARAAGRPPRARRAGRVPVGVRGDDLRPLRLRARVAAARGATCRASAPAFAAPAEPYGRIRRVDARGGARALPGGLRGGDATSGPGMFGRSEVWWQERALPDEAAARRPGAPARPARGRRPRRGVRGLRGAPELRGRLVERPRLVVEALGRTPEATRAIWRFLLDLDWTTRVRADKLPVDHPLVLLLAEPRRAGARLGDALWVRLVDVGAALSARSYAGERRGRLRGARRVLPLERGPLARLRRRASSAPRTRRTSRSTSPSSAPSTWAASRSASSRTRCASRS